MNRTVFIAIGSIATMTVVAAQDREHLQLVAPDGEIVASAEGGIASVTLDPSVDAMLRRADAHLRLTHNHPHGRGLSGADLEQLSKPGVASIEATAADGSWYEATRGPRFDDRPIEGRYRMAERAITQYIGETRPSSADRAVIDREIAHVVAVALQKAQVIGYRWTLEPSRAASYERYRVMFGHAAELAAARLRR